MEIESMELCLCIQWGEADPPIRQWQGSKSVKLLLKMFPEATLCWTILVFVVWRFGGLLFCFGFFFWMKAVHYSLFPDVPNSFSIFLPLFHSINISVSWTNFLLGADQTDTCEGLEIQNWGIFRMVSVVIFTHNSMGIITAADVLV